MNLSFLHKKLIAAAKANPPSENVPYAFEQRIIAHLRSRRLPDGLSLWAGALWRAAVPCVTLSILLGAWAFLAAGPGTATNDFSQEMENTVLVAVDHPEAEPVGEVN